MKLKIVIALAILISLYLYVTYARIYYSIGKGHLPSPYKQQTFSLNNPDQEGYVKYVALGDSLSAGVGSSTIENTIVYSYAQHLSSKARIVNTVNLAYPGATTVDVINSQLSQAISENPDYITLFIGINDVHARKSNQDFEKNYSLILNSLLKKTSAKIIVINLPQLGAKSLMVPPISNYFDFRTREFNGIILSQSRKERVKLIDLYDRASQAFQNDTGLYSSDLYHPSEKGYAVWSNIINAD